MIRKALTFLAFVLPALGVNAAFAQANGPDAPAAIVISYRVQPDARAKFRRIMQTEGIVQLNRWQKEGVFASYKALYTAYAGAGNSLADMFLILRFRHFTDIAAWQKIERTTPGGLPVSAQAIAFAQTSDTADILKEEGDGPSTPDSQYVIVDYDVLTDLPHYRDYALGYAVPQFEEWMQAGVLKSFTALINQNPAGAPWSSFILLEYKNLEAVGRREIVKDQVRVHLGATNPAWKKWSEDKSSIRKEQAGILATALN